MWKWHKEDDVTKQMMCPWLASLAGLEIQPAVNLLICLFVCLCLKVFRGAVVPFFLKKRCLTGLDIQFGGFPPFFWGVPFGGLQIASRSDGVPHQPAGSEAGGPRMRYFLGFGATVGNRFGVGLKEYSS